MRQGDPTSVLQTSSRSAATRRTEGAETQLPPGPRLPALGQALHLALRTTRFLDDCARRFGDCFVLRFPGAPPVVTFSHPEAIRQIFTAGDEALRAGESNAPLGPLLGRNSLLLLDADRHLRERRLMTPPFHGERMQAYSTVINEVADRAIDSWPTGRAFAFQGEMQGITLDVIMQAVFGIDANADGGQLRSQLRDLVKVAANPLWLVPALRFNLGPLTPWAQLLRTRKAVERTLYAEFARRRATDLAHRNDILSMLLAARHEDGSEMTNEELRDEMITLLLAGHETTATALAWTAYHVLSRPDVLARVQAEVASVVGDAKRLSADHVAQLIYLDAVVKEALRLNPILDDVGRMVRQPVEVGGWRLPAGVIAAPQIYLAHRRADLWPEPTRFDPERFLGQRISPYAFLPFGGGARRCLGMALALYEMKIVLARIFARTDLQIAPGYQARTVRRAITLAPSRGVPVVMKRRTD